MATKKTVTIVGAGALGSHLVLLSRNWDVSLKLIDFDYVEQKNIRSQFHTKMGLRQNKAHALGKAMLGMFGTKLDARVPKLTIDNVEILLGGSDLVIDCTDNFEARTLIQDYCKDQETPCLHGGLSADGQFARVIWSEDFTPDHEGTPGQATCEDGDHVAFYAMAGAQIAIIAKKFLETGKRVNLQMTPSSIMHL
jgi:molybdopterin-synthase adenylyltransferase